MIFISALISALFSFVFAAVLAIRLRKTYPELHSSVDTPVGTEWMPFWVFHFLRPNKFRGISFGLKILAIVSIASLALSITLFLTTLLRFASQGGSL